jgi:hypothetical protein
LIEIGGARSSGGAQGGAVVRDEAERPFVAQAPVTKQAVTPNRVPPTLTRDGWRTPWSRRSDQELRLQAYRPTAEHIREFVPAIRHFAPKNLTGEWIDRVSRDLVLTGVNQSVRRVERSGSRAHIFKSDTDHLLVFIPNPDENLGVTWGKDLQDIHGKAPILLSNAPSRVQLAAAAALKEMAVALAHRAA